MRILVLGCVALGIALLATTVSSRAEACSCEFVPTAERFDSADAVFEATIVATHPIDLESELRPLEVEVTMAWKGVEVGDRIRLHTPAHDSTCHPMLDGAESWLVFATRSDGTMGTLVPEGELSASATCGGAIPSEHATEVRDELDDMDGSGCRIGSPARGSLVIVALLFVAGRRRRQQQSHSQVPRQNIWPQKNTAS